MAEEHIRESAVRHSLRVLATSPDGRLLATVADHPSAVRILGPGNLDRTLRVRSGVLVVVALDSVGSVVQLAHLHEGGVTLVTWSPATGFVVGCF